MVTVQQPHSHVSPIYGAASALAWVLQIFRSLSCAVMYTVQTLIVRAKAAQQLEAESPAWQMSLSSSPHRHSLPPQQLGKARRAMETQQEGILKCQQKLALLMSATGKG